MYNEPDIRLCPDCQRSVDYGDMIWLNGRCTCPPCYLKRRKALDSKDGEHYRSVGDCVEEAIGYDNE